MGLRVIAATIRAIGETSLSYPVYDALRREKSVLSEVMVYVPLSIDKVGVRIDAEPETAGGPIW